MNNEKRFEIVNKIVSVEQIKQVSDYLQKTKNYYLDVIKHEKEKAKSQNKYDYNPYSKATVEYSIEYTDGRQNKFEDEYVFKQELEEPQYIKEINFRLWISYATKDEYEIDDYKSTSRTMSLYLTLRDNSIYFTTSDQNMNEPSYNMNSYVRSILESGGDSLDSVIKNRFWIKQIISFGIGSIIFLIIFLVLWILNFNGSEIYTSLTENGIIFFSAFLVCSSTIGNLIGSPLINSFYGAFTNTLSTNKDKTQTIKNEYMKEKNEVLIGKNYDNLNIRNEVKKLYNIFKKVVLATLLIAIVLSVIFLVI